MKKISDKPLCFSVTTKEIARNNFILSPGYYAEKKKNNKLIKWFKELSLKQKEMLKAYFKFDKEIHKK